MFSESSQNQSALYCSIIKTPNINGNIVEEIRAVAGIATILCLLPSKAHTLHSNMSATMILVSLPLNLLQLVTDALFSHDLGRLICCGNRKLTQRLGEGGGVLRVRHEFRNLDRLLWPSLVKYFPRMLSFSMVMLPDLMYSCSSLSLAPFWGHLPETLQNIELSYPTDTSSFLVPMTLKRFPHLESVSCSEEVFDEDTDFVCCDLRHDCNKISSLSLRGGDFFVAYMPFDLRSLTLNGSITTKLDHTFPESLTSLSLRDDDESLQPGIFDCIASLPFLETLVLHFPTPLTLQELLQLPKTLTTLKVSVITELSASTLRLLPPNLKTLHLAGAYVLGENIKFIPRSVTSTNLLSFIIKKDLASLPPNLQDIGKSSTSVEVASLLPRSITSAVELQFTSSWTRRNSSFTPSQRLLRCPGLPNAPETVFPTTMTALELQEHDCLEDLPAGTCCQLPDSIKHLIIRKRAHKKLPLTDDFLVLLPQQLLSLEIAGASISSISFDHLPATLTLFKLSCDNLPIGASATLPTTLTKLHLIVDSIDEGFGADLLSHLPEGLRMLHFEMLGQRVDCQVGNEDVMKLPMRITWVSLPASSLLTSDCVANLPPTVAFFHSHRINYQK